MNQAIILAAGKGTRMKSDLPKVAHEVCGKSMIELILKEVKKTNVEDIVTVLGYGSDIIVPKIENQSLIAYQTEQLGTGHAVMQATQIENNEGHTLVINGDCPLISHKTLTKMLEENEKHGAVVLTIKLKDPKEYGRVILNKDLTIDRIVELKDCTEGEKSISLINTGIYCFDNKLLFSCLKELKNDNSQNEYYITDLVKIINSKGISVGQVECYNHDEVFGINSQKELAYINKVKRALINESHLENGGIIVDPLNCYIDDDVVIEPQAKIYPNVHLRGNTVIGSKTIVDEGSVIIDSIIGASCKIENSKIINSSIKSNVTVGPYAHIREGCIVESHNRVGNFVELKAVTLAEDSRCAHLTYLGNASVGSKVNIGCGVITVNYDGKDKYKTVIEDGSFIGSNCNLIAPITIGKDALVAAGSTVNKDIPSGDMGIARPRQENVAGYGFKYKKKA